MGLADLLIPIILWIIYIIWSFLFGKEKAREIVDDLEIIQSGKTKHDWGS